VSVELYAAGVSVLAPRRERLHLGINQWFQQVIRLFIAAKHMERVSEVVGDDWAQRRKTLRSPKMLQGRSVAPELV